MVGKGPKPGARVQCLRCGSIIQSKSRHDFQRCECGDVFVDGGSDYFRMGAADLDGYVVLDPQIETAEEEIDDT